MGVAEYTFKGRYDDLPSEIDYHDGMNTLLAANDAFNSLTSKIRRRFNNDPAEFLDFVLNEDNLEEINSLGLGVSATHTVTPAPDPGVPAGGELPTPA